jgi:dienelactone hydrolase
MRASVATVGRARIVFAILAAALVCAGSASAAPGWTAVTIDASDATPLACAYIIPSGTAPAGGWPGVIIFHGLGQSHTDMEPYGSALAQFGFAALACDARGTGASGGKFGLDGPTEVQDAQDLFTWFAARSDISDTQIGALGLSLGGAEVWNAATAGVPFKAIVPAITWTDLVRALAPASVPKEGLVFQLAQLYPGQWDTSLAQARDDLLGGTVTQAVRAAAAARSSRPTLHSLHVPTLILQGRHDFLFDMDQALAAYRLLAGPKRLYLGDLGHPPATNPSAEQPTYLAEALGWFEEYLAGGPKLVGGGVELAHDPWDGTTTLYKNVPRTRHVSVSLPGTKKLFGGGSVHRTVRLPGGPLETFGDGFLSVRYSGNGGQWTDMRAMVSVKGSKTPVTVGAAPLTRASGTLKIPLLDEAVLLPRGRRLVVTVGATSADGVYSLIVGNGAPGGPPAIKIGRVTLNLSLLRRAVSK